MRNNILDILALDFGAEWYDDIKGSKDGEHIQKIANIFTLERINKEYHKWTNSYFNMAPIKDNRKETIKILENYIKVLKENRAVSLCQE